MNNVLAKLGGRKFVLAIFGVIAIAAHNYLGISQETVMVVGGVVASYIFGQGIADGLSGGATSSTPPPPLKNVTPNNNDLG